MMLVLFQTKQVYNQTSITGVTHIQGAWAIIDIVVAILQGCTPPPNAAAPVKFATPPRRVLSRRCENLKSKILAKIKFLNFDNMQHI